MRKSYTLEFRGELSVFAPDLALDDRSQELQPPPASSNRLPYIFITVYLSSLLPCEASLNEECQMPILLEEVYPDPSNPERMRQVRGKIFCIHDMRLYDPAGYAFSGQFDALRRLGSLKFECTEAQPKNPQPTELMRRYQHLQPLGQYPYSDEPQRGAPITTNVLPF